MSEALQGLDRVFKKIDRIERNVKNARRPLQAAATYMVGSVQKDFKAEGRPAHWAPLAASTVAGRRRGKGRGGIKILTDTGRLKNSVSTQVSSTEAQVGTNVIYAKRQHFGYPGGSGRGHAKTPPRPFMMFQTEDYDAIGHIFSREIFER